MKRKLPDDVDVSRHNLIRGRCRQRECRDRLEGTLDVTVVSLKSPVPLIFDRALTVKLLKQRE